MGDEWLKEGVLDLLRDAGAGVGETEFDHAVGGSGGDGQRPALFLASRALLPILYRARRILLSSMTRGPV